MKVSQFYYVYSILISLSILTISRGATVAFDNDGVVASTVSESDAGVFTYSYALINTTGTFPIGLFSVAGAVPADWDQVEIAGGGSVTVPSSDWIADGGIGVPGGFTQDFIALPGGDLPIGAIGSGFSFSSNFRFGDVQYFIFDVGSGDHIEGTTLGPVPVPEPKAFLYFTMALGLLFSRKRSRISSWHPATKKG